MRKSLLSCDQMRSFRAVVSEGGLILKHRYNNCLVRMKTELVGRF